VIVALALVFARKRLQPVPALSRVRKVMAAIAALASTIVRKRPRPVTILEAPVEPVPVPSLVRDLKIIPSRVKPGKIVNVFAEATNTGPTTSSYSLVLKVKGIVEAVKEITLVPGQSQKVAFVILRDKPGVYDVDLEGLKGSFTVES